MTPYLSGEISAKVLDIEENDTVYLQLANYALEDYEISNLLELKIEKLSLDEKRAKFIDEQEEKKSDK